MSRSGANNSAALRYPVVLCSEMRPLRALAVVLIVIVVLSMIMLRAGLRSKTVLVRPIPVMVDSATDADIKELPTDEAQSVQTEAERADTPTRTEFEVQTDTEGTEAQTPPKPVNPAVELTLLRHTSVDKVRAV